MAPQKVDKEKFSIRLKLLMSENEETVYSLAEVIGLSAATISRYSTGEMSPKNTTVAVMSGYFKVNSAWLAGGEVPRDLPKAEGFRLERREEQMIQKYRALDEHGKALVTVALDSEYKRMSAGKSKEDTDIILPVAARSKDGTPKTIRIRKDFDINDLPDRNDF